nr:hypothetical protein [Candidatus Cloacimonadota bacterium]
MKQMILFLMLASIFLFACEIKEPVMPIWDLDLNIPLINERYLISELADSVNIIIDDNDLMYLETEGELDTPEVGEVYISPNLELMDLPVLSGTEISQSVPIGVDEQNLNLRYGLVESGNIKVRFASVDPTVQELSLSILDIHQPDGEPFVIEYAGSDEWINIDLAGYYFGSLDATESLTELTVQLSATSSQPDYTPIAELSILMVDPLSFGVFAGDLEEYEIFASGSTASIQIEYPFGIDQAIQVSDVYLEIGVENELGFECEFIGFLRGSRGDLSLTVPILDDNGQNFRIAPSTLSGPVYSTLMIHDGFQDIIQMMPETIEIIDARFIIDSQSGSGILHKDDKLRADYTVQVPFRLTIFDYPITMQETTEIDITEDNRDLIENNLLESSLIMQVQNKLPIGGTAYAYFGSEAEIDVDDPQSYGFVKSLSIQSSQISQDWQEPATLELSKSELDLFTLPQVYLKWSFHFDATDDEVEIYASPEDFIGLKSMLHAKVRVEDN